MKVRHDCDQSEHVQVLHKPAEHSSHLLSLLSLLLFKCLKEILTIFTIYNS